MIDSTEASEIGDTVPSLSAIKPGFKDPLIGDQVLEFEKCLNECANLQPPAPPQSPIPGVMWIDDVLSQEICRSFINAFDECAEVSFWNTGGRADRNSRLFRDADTVEVQSTMIARYLWDRIKDLFLPVEVNVSDEENDHNWERELVGNWRATSLNHELLFAKYPSGGHFAPHTDGRAIHDFNARSFYSVVIFLNSVPSEMGAGTKFFTEEALRSLSLSPCGNYWKADPSTTLYEVPAVAGRILIFHQSMAHEGVAPLYPHSKYIIRSDVIFTRDPPLCNSPSDKTAFKLFQEGELLAEKGENDDAIILFRKAFKLSPALAVIMGQS